MAQVFFDIKVNRNRIDMYGDLRLQSLDSLTSTLYQIAVKARYPDVVLDMSNLSSITDSVVPPVAAYLRYLTQQYKVDYSLVMPRNQKFTK